MSSSWAGGRPAARVWWWRIGAVVLLAGVLRSVVSAWVFPVTLLGDELSYTETAIRVARGEGHVFGAYGMKARWPPGQAYLLSLAVDSELVADHPALFVEPCARFAGATSRSPTSSSAWSWPGPRRWS